METSPLVANEREQALLRHAREHQVPCMSSATEAFLLQHLMTYKPTYCLEIGSAVGYSTSRIAHTIQKRGGYISFEISHPSYRTAMYHLRQQQLRNVTLYHQDIRTSPLAKIITHPLDMVFVDGAKGEYASYVEAILPFCTPTTTIICDDVLMYPDKIAPLYELLEHHKLAHQCVTLADDDGVLVITRE